MRQKVKSVLRPGKDIEIQSGTIIVHHVSEADSTSGKVSFKKEVGLNNGPGTSRLVKKRFLQCSENEIFTVLLINEHYSQG